MQLNPKTVKTLRQTLNWTQQQLADACDLSLRTIQRVEKEGTASKETTMALCAVLEVRQGELIKLEDDTNSSAVNPALSTQNITSILALSSVISFILGMITVFFIMS
ncbi:helix-turn-helix transcriptional regulator [Pseudoalteromonas carrageenovora]|uniref:helix-turn-helix domain-containing protein n=1 Tax=Pseudoalteromonas carrageenovora TaxID=227 RepID=UPI0026E34249|nr:helix-turn-helix transcriptional regulator [Pseudoalteromonas carrageenovora]MDO6634706.1 helix-turn-helix transcriptional regulator [Pseudoalteromonas carrageenovora]MDO6648341.1 helix-turn-helix transcriptional regulator [Pseudoalteromonas carrageenovora]MDO6834106.1 helix-turn-helix transcriptional regulator [Pseudoalteromonas carrageenovora]